MKRTNHRLVLFVLILSLWNASSLWASHYRGGTVRWESLNSAAPYQIRVTFTTGWRVGVGGSVSGVNWDGGTATGGGTTTIFSNSEFIINEQVYTVTYATAGNKTINWTGCCRISNPPLQNNPDGTWELETVINVGAGNTSPFTYNPIIIEAPAGITTTYKLPGVDTDFDSNFEFDSIQFRQGVASEFSDNTGGSGMPGIVSLASDGTLTITPGGTNDNRLYNVWVMVEDYNPDGSGPKTKIPIDFLIQVTAVTNQSATITDPTSPETIDNPLGFCSEFDFTAEDPEGDTITITAINDIDGLEYSTTLLQAGPPRRVRLDGSVNPVASNIDQTGVQFPIFFRIHDDGGILGHDIFTHVTINIIETQKDPLFHGSPF